MRLNAKGLKLFGSRFCAGWIVAPVQVSSDRQTGLSFGGANEAKDLLVAVEWFPGAVLGDRRKEAMLDAVLFGSARGVVGDGEREAV